MMNDQTSPTADGQRPDPLDPFAPPRDAPGLPPVPPGGSGVSARGDGFRTLLAKAKPDLTAAAVLAVSGALLGVLAGLAWYRFAPTVWLSVPADAVPQLKTGSGLDTPSLLVSPEGKGLASVDGYYFVMTAIAGVLLGVLAFYLGRRGFGGERPKAAATAVTAAAANQAGGGGQAVQSGFPGGGFPGVTSPAVGAFGPVRPAAPAAPAATGAAERAGAGVGAWAGVLVGGFLAATIARLVGHWVSLPDPMNLLRTIADGHAFHAPVTLRTSGLLLTAPVLSLVAFTALTAAFTSSPPPPQWVPYGDRMPQGYFSPENPYGFRPPGTPQGGGQYPGGQQQYPTGGQWGAPPAPQPEPTPTAAPGSEPTPDPVAPTGPASEPRGNV